MSAKTNENDFKNKTMKKILLFVLTLSIVLPSCTIEKRLYRPGFHVELANQKSAKAENLVQTESKEKETIVSSHLDTKPQESENSVVLELENSEESVSPIASNLNAGDEPKIFQVTIEPERTAEVESGQRVQEFDIPLKKDKNTAITSGGSKSQLVALLLCFFVGIIGIHRFYLGYIGIGVIQLLTLGGFGIWALIDLILIITGDLKPKEGEYDKTF